MAEAASTAYEIVAEEAVSTADEVLAKTASKADDVLVEATSTVDEVKTFFLPVPSPCSFPAVLREERSSRRTFSPFTNGMAEAAAGTRAAGAAARAARVAEGKLRRMASGRGPRKSGRRMMRRGFCGNASVVATDASILL